MSNIFNNNFTDIKINVNYDEYWDFFLDKTCFEKYNFYPHITKDCLISWIDVSLYDCVFENEINSLPNYFWDKAISQEFTFNNIGYTGFDNGLLYFRKDQIMNSDFIELYKNSKLTINRDKGLFLHQVTGSTMVYEYPIEVEDFQIKLNGGFYQGFFKTECDQYQVLPSHLVDNDTWSYEFVMKKSNLEKESNKTLNDKYPNNKGIFFYIGTRAENKWDYLYREGEDECFALSPDDYVEDAKIEIKNYKIDAFLDMSLNMPTPWEDEASDEYVDYTYQFDIKSPQIHDVEDVENFMKIKIQNCNIISKCEIFDEVYVDLPDELECDYDYLENDIDISNFIFETDNNFIIGEYEKFLETDNKFLLFGRQCDGVTIKTWEEGMRLRYMLDNYEFNDNLFLLMNRTYDGYNVQTIDQIRKKKRKNYNIYADLYNNALAFRITDNGEIGYRYLIKDCNNINEPYKIIEGYSKPNIIKNDEWVIIHVKISSFHDTMQLRFYVNGVLVYVTTQIPKLNLRKLKEIDSKQESVPYNISLGGGTQGLCDVILPNYMIEPYRVYPLEKHFGGTFIGYLKSFKMYNCDIEYLDIFNNFQYEINNLKLN